MVKRRILYALSLLGCLVFYVAHGQWLSWLLLCLVAGLPVLSLLLSLLELCFLQPQLRIPEEMTQGHSMPLSVTFTKSPLMTWQYRVDVTNMLTGQKYSLDAGDHFPASHCGLLQCSTKGLYMTDHLGLFRLRLLPEKTWQLPVRPIPVPMNISNDIQRLMAQSWQPKPGGGFSEQHDLRLYRPGDNLNQIHWKLSAKTGKYIIREAMIPNHGRILVTMYLRGSNSLLDEKLGNLLWLGQYLLRQGTPFTLHVLTAEGITQLSISQAKELDDALTALLSAQTAPTDAVMEPVSAAWQCHIGGDADET